ncbi:MAG TPA: hypothetical protein VIM10_01810 [Actinopolymorphaceae bacterium]|jgi:hypothetical protein
MTLKEQGTVHNAQGRAIIIDGLWALTPGNGVEAGTDLLATLSLR